MVELDNKIVLAIVVGSFVSGLFIRVLTFIIKSRCRNIKCCCVECERDVINQANLNNTIIRDIEIPQITSASRV